MSAANDAAVHELSIVLGTVGLFMTFTLTLATVLFFGAMILAYGVLQLVHAFSCKGWKAILGHVLIAALYIGVGILIIIDPVIASTTLTLVLAAMLIAVGVIRIRMAFQMRGSVPSWYWALLSGVISILLGAMIILQWPASGLWIIGLFVAVELIFNVWAYVFVALAARKVGQGDMATA